MSSHVGRVGKKRGQKFLETRCGIRLTFHLPDNFWVIYNKVYGKSIEKGRTGREI